MGRRDHTGEGHPLGTMMRKPPMTPVKFRDGGAVEECELMKFGERIRDVIFLPVDLTNPVHWQDFTGLRITVVRRITDENP